MRRRNLRTTLAADMSKMDNADEDLCWAMSSISIVKRLSRTSRQILRRKDSCCYSNALCHCQMDTNQKWIEQLN